MLSAFCCTRSTGAVEQPGGNNIEQREIAGDMTENLFEMREDRAGKLVHKETSSGAQHGVRLHHDSVANAKGQGLERYSRNHVVHLIEAEPLEDSIDGGCRFLKQVKPRVFNRLFQELAEVRVDLQGDQVAIGVQALQDILSKRPGASAVFDDDSRSTPIDLFEESADQEPRAGE